MRILAVNHTHDASVCLLHDGEVVFYSKEERFSRRKRDALPYRAVLEVERTVGLAGVDAVVLCSYNGIDDDGVDADVKGYVFWGFINKFSRAPLTNLSDKHHLLHAANAFYASGFDSALAVIADGAGSTIGLEGGAVAVEVESAYRCSYPAEFAPLYKSFLCTAPDHRAVRDALAKRFSSGTEIVVRRYGVTNAYQAVTRHIGENIIEAGKTMGLAAYGKDSGLPRFFDGDRATDLVLDINHLNAARIALPAIERVTEDNAAPYADLAWRVQHETAERMEALIGRLVAQTGEPRVCISGGYGMNCVANYRYRRSLDLDLYADPLADDSGITIGGARLLHHHTTGDRRCRPLHSLYFSGHAYDFAGGRPATAAEVVELILQGHVVALFQGHAEAGARALGNRSILFDPRSVHGKDIVNRVKKREWYRPFAASVLAEQAHEWFDLAGMPASPFMTYTLDVLPHRRACIPAVTHVDGTCRAQTVSREQNARFYDLIAEFARRTGVPMLLNTSFNLAGEPLVESVDDALATLRNSALKAVYFAQQGRLVEQD